MWMLVRGKNPNTGQEVDQWNCSFAFLPMLMIENSQQARGVGAAVESFRNEMAGASASFVRMVMQRARENAPPQIEQ
jgi:hypothetical protein